MLKCRDGEMTFQSEPEADFYSNFWLTAVTIDPSRAGVDREETEGQRSEGREGLRD
jgi:hypothetical protein